MGTVARLPDYQWGLPPSYQVAVMANLANPTVMPAHAGMTG